MEVSARTAYNIDNVFLEISKLLCTQTPKENYDKLILGVRINSIELFTIKF